MFFTHSVLRVEFAISEFTPAGYFNKENIVLHLGVQCSVDISN